MKMVESVKKILLLLKMIEVNERSVRLKFELISILNIMTNCTDSYHA